jgi:hypothetical protein
LVDKEFRQLLLSHEEVVADFDLMTEERRAVLDVKAGSPE